MEREASPWSTEATERVAEEEVVGGAAELLAAEEVVEEALEMEKGLEYWKVTPVASLS